MNVKFFETTLSNGLKVIGEQKPKAKSSALGFFVRTGARDESDEVSGVSHFLEHMIFKGTEKRSALDITYELGAIGAQANAFTSEENTVYYMAVLPEYFSTGLELLSDMMRPALDQKEFDTEKKVILEEIALYQDRPSFVLFEATLAEYFSPHSAGNSVLGTTESISALSREQMVEYFNSHYTASNIVLAASGNFDWGRLVEDAEKYCGGWPTDVVERDLSVHSPQQKSRLLTKENLQLAHLCYVAPGPSATDDARYASKVLSCILGDSSGSKAYWSLIDKGLADAVSIDADDMDHTGIIAGYVSALPEKIDQVGDILRNIMCAASEFSDDELRRAKTKLKSRLVLREESTMRRLMALGGDWTYREEYLPLDQGLIKLDQIDRAAIENMLNRFDFKPTCCVKLLPK